MVLYAPFFMNIFQIGKIGNLGTKIIIEEKFSELQNHFSSLSHPVRHNKNKLNVINIFFISPTFLWY